MKNDSHIETLESHVGGLVELVMYPGMKILLN